MKQYRITTQDLLPPSDNDCFLSPDDPIHQLMAVSQLGGLGSDAALANYNALSAPQVVGSNKGQIARELGIKPGTDEWFRLWFSRPGLTGDKPYNKED